MNSLQEGGKLYIFLELVSQGSLAALYQKYHLQDSQVSAYTRQILNGLHYLHRRNVLHRSVGRIRIHRIPEGGGGGLEGAWHRSVVVLDLSMIDSKHTSR